MARRLGPAILAVWLAVFAIAAVGCSAAPSPPSSGPLGRIDIAVTAADPDNPLFEPVYRARAVSRDGSVDAAWRIRAGAAPTEVPAGYYRIEAFTVFLSDTIVCADAGGVIGGPGSTGAPGATCLQPTLDPPGQVCALEIDVPATGTVHVRFTDNGRGGCQLADDKASPT